jgi:DNA-binding CsgD family transcriptional regulator
VPGPGGPPPSPVHDGRRTRSGQPDADSHEIAQALVVAPRTVAAHLEHILAKLDAPTRTLAAVRAERDGLYVPAVRS